MSNESSLKTFVVKDSEGERHIITADRFSTWGPDGSNVYLFIRDNVIASFRNFMIVSERSQS